MTKEEQAILKAVVLDLFKTAKDAASISIDCMARAKVENMPYLGNDAIMQRGRSIDISESASYVRDILSSMGVDILT